MADNIESLEVSGILPSDSNQPIAADDYEPNSSVSENDENSTGGEIEGVSTFSSHRRSHKSIHVHRTQEPTVQPTIIPSTYASFRLSNVKVSQKGSYCQDSYNKRYVFNPMWCVYAAMYLQQ